jgi:hypothetical protein
MGDGETKEDTLPTYSLLNLTLTLTITFTITITLTITVTFTIALTITVTITLTLFATFYPCNYLSVQRFVRATNFLQPFLRDNVSATKCPATNCPATICLATLPSFIVVNYFGCIWHSTFSMKNTKIY